jgi:ATP adenylyltransferase/5',5'''-P-1,P-4-tetraphosphate phosphorylase II
MRASKRRQKLFTPGQVLREGRLLYAVQGLYFYNSPSCSIASIF